LFFFSADGLAPIKEKSMKSAVIRGFQAGSNNSRYPRGAVIQNEFSFSLLKAKNVYTPTETSAKIGNHPISAEFFRLPIVKVYFQFNHFLQND